ncbi:hypothetical protein Dsin_014127 [Dipteronia sinensis]|uniref:Sieve element occlusion C-terminal domain-containing protein n=1 Tax=Dipteronia sinensis TaxID=43782 RepID=A0AAE0ALM9_9ROSI|nr:hypothetical protein Dsin_014127 [Dipteronia sinensis]
MEAYQNLIRLMESPHDDNMNTMRALIYAKNNKRVLVAGSTRKRVKLGVLRRKIVLLLISDLEVSEEDLSGLKKIYQESHQNPTRTESQYEVVWIPIVDVRTTPWTEEKQQQFEALQGMMPWYLVYKPSMLAPQVIRYIKEVWRFNKKPVVVALDQQGKSMNNNVLHMLLIWGSLAFPFTRDREEALWREESWRIELVADTLHPAIPTWIEEKKHICLYGGGDIEWIRKFTLTAKAVAEDAGIPLEMLYVGKSGPRKILRNIALEKLGSHALQDLNHINFFWMRLESMWHSKMGLNSTIESDAILEQILTILSFDGGEQGWAEISNGSEIVARARGETILRVLGDYDMWKEYVNQEGFTTALNDHLKYHLDEHPNLNSMIIYRPIFYPTIREKVVCAECGLEMEAH